ncbi:hypothetical protein BJ170DRAFT_626185 [Xylariales sp. AK1849]|nr:hypothetical protein BJ170DRAFT_626185 [Xylariales sp. AK1849]
MNTSSHQTMSVITASNEYHDPAPPGCNRSSVQADAPSLVPLFDSCPGIHVYTRSHPQFTALSQVRAERTDITPLAVVRPTTEVEISLTVSLCSATRLPVAIRNGGNDVAERSRSNGGVVIDIRSMDSIALASDRQSVRIGGGVTQGKLLKFLDENGLDTPCGWGHEIGYVAWACGGGYGVECGSRGLGADQILGGRIVTAAGETVVVAEGKGDSDAWWALRGGGAGVIGVVSELTVAVYTKPRVLAGYIWFSYGEIEKVLGNMQKLYAEDFPDNFAGEVFLIDPLNNEGVINHFFWWELKDDESDLDRAKAYHEKITSCGTVIMDTVKDNAGNYVETTPYNFLYTIENPRSPMRLAFFNESAIVPSFSAELGAVFTRHPLPTTTSCIVLHNCHGAGARADSTAAFGNRSPHLLVGIVAVCNWEDEETRKRIESWPDNVYAEIVAANLHTGWKYVNFNPREKGDGRMYLGQEGVSRMKRIKGRLDADNLFADSTPDLEL